MGFYARTLRGRFSKQRVAAQLIEEALLLSVALVALSLLVGGVDSILKEAGNYTTGIWSNITNELNNALGSVFHW